jgi:predicted PurR-regulated permease PerM
MAAQHSSSAPSNQSPPALPGAAWGLGTVVLLAAFVWLILQVQAVLSALLGSVLLAALLEPAVVWLARVHIGRWTVGRRLAAGIMVIAFLAILGTLIYFLAPVLARQASVLLTNIPPYLDKVRGEYQAITSGMQILPDDVLAAFQREFANLMGQLGRSAAQAALGIAGNVIGLLGLLVIPVGAFYVLSDGATIQADFLAALPPQWREPASVFLHDTSRALSSYVRGQTLVCASSAVLYTIIFGVLGMPYFVVLGILAGVAEAIPYLGSVLVGVAVVIIGVQSDLGLAMRGLIGYLVGNQVVNYILTPRFQSRSLHLHPFLVILAALTGASLGGPVGAFIALPAAAVLQALLTRMWGPQAARKRPRPSAD